MKNIILKTLLAVILSAGLFAGCDYVPSTIYEIETTDGRILKLRCPTVDRDRSTLTYIIDSECVAVK